MSNSPGGLIVWPARLRVPFGFALFFLRSVAPTSVKTSDIYWGAIPFVCIQILMVLLVILFPQMVTVGLDKTEIVDIDSVEIILPETDYDTPLEIPPSLEIPADVPEEE